MRVRLTTLSPILVLTSDLGTLVRPAEVDGWWIVRLDAPAGYLDTGTGETTLVTEVGEHERYLAVLESDG